MPEPSSATYRFGDLLALAREYWVRQMAEQLAPAGYPDYRRTDAAMVRLLRQGPRSIGEIGAALHISRQAARKLVTGLERRGYATAEKDVRDGRQLNVSLTPHGKVYTQAVIDTIDTLVQRVAERVDPEQLRAADAVLGATLPHDEARNYAARLIPPPEPGATATRPARARPPRRGSTSASSPGSA